MDPQGNPINSLRSITLELPPSCIEFCPAYPEFFVVGTYNLQKEEPDVGDSAMLGEEDEGTQHGKQPQSRNGSLVLFALTGTDM